MELRIEHLHSPPSDLQWFDRDWCDHEKVAVQLRHGQDVINDSLEQSVCRNFETHLG